MARYRSHRDARRADTGRAIAMTAYGVAVFAPIELALSGWAYSGPVEARTFAHLVPLVATYSLWLWLILRFGLAGVMRATRWLRGRLDARALTAEGWFVAGPLADGVRPNVPVLWAILASTTVAGALIAKAAAWAEAEYKEAQLRGLLIAGVALGCVAIARGTYPFFKIAARTGATALAPILQRFNPLGRWRAAGIALAGAIGGALVALWFALPQSHSVLPARLAISAIALAFGMGIGAYRHAHIKRRPRTRKTAFALAGATLVVMMATLLYWGGDPEARWLALTASPAFHKLDDSIRLVTDVDRDGYGSLLGENDCAPFDSSIHPGAVDIPDDGIDQNCDGHDFSLHVEAAPSGPKLPVPAQFKKDWNFLFITIDTVRYDHTTFGGYADSPKHRDTTPRLAELVKRSTSFTFCNAPSAGTMASIPAIITSKYFHDGLALDVTNVPPGMPPRLKPENTLLPEIMKRANYRTGVIASHEYWNDWGMDQGVDDYDNSIGKTPDPFRIAADKVTDHALAWISREQGHKWFLWAHYIDPHGRYMAHPDVVDYGSTEPDLYDAEIKWTDQQIGRLLDELQRLPSTPNTIIVITSDHGDSMGEHTVPVGTHGTALYRELQHVPMIFYIPDNAPHLIGGATSNLDIVPTIAELAGIDVHDLSFEGRSEVPAIFYGKEDHSRIVFAETNAPTPQRAAISEAFKLIYYLQSNIYELYDLKADPWEHDNLAPKHPAAFAQMKAALDAWLERVVYSRDADFNQANERIKDVLLGTTAPKPVVETTGQTLDGGKIQIIGIGAENKLVAGGKADIQVYFRVNERTSEAYRFLVAIWPVDPATWKPTDAAPATMLRSQLRATADGFFTSERWREHEYVRERFPLTIPADYKGAIAVGLVAVDATGKKAQATADAPANDPELIVLGVLPLVGS